MGVVCHSGASVAAAILLYKLSNLPRNTFRFNVSMFKIAAFVSLMLIVTWSQADSRRRKKEGSSSEEFNSGNLLAGSLSCDSCGNECASACGTRHFRSCCFNYLRRKRGPETVKLAPQRFNDFKMDKYQRQALPMFLLEEIPEQWISFLESADIKPYYLDNTADNRLQAMYDA